MKKSLSLVLVCIMVLIVMNAHAMDMGVQIIGGPEQETEPVSLDDLKLNIEAEIPGWGILVLTSFEVQNQLGYYKAGKHETGNVNDDYYWSGNEADYVVLYADIRNTTVSKKNYLDNVSVRVVYDEIYEYNGWSYQRNYDNTEGYHYNWDGLDVDKGKYPQRWVINAADNFAINPMYEGHYIYGCTLPNAIISSKKTLKMIISLDGNEITYYIRK